MPVSGLDHLNLTAPRALLDRLRDFYRDVVGLAPGERPPFANHGYWLYAGANPILHLSEAAPGETSGTDVRGTFHHMAFACRDRAAFERHLERCGVPFRRADVPGTGQVQLFLEDPAGNGIELNFRTDRS